jgi:MFS family permease
VVGPYRNLLRTAGTPRIFAGYFAGRLPAGMVTIAVALAFVDTPGGLTRVGLVIGAYSLAIAATAPVLGRLADRFGARVVLRVSGTAYVVLLLLLALSRSAPAGVSVALSIGCGATYPPVAPTVRALWSRVWPSGSLRAAAFGLDAALVELLYLVGPLLATALALVGGPRLPLLGLAGLSALGVVLVTTSRLLPIAPAVQAVRTWWGPLGRGPVRVLLAVVVLTSAAFGLVEIGVIAFARATGHPWYAGPLLAVAAAGSLVGGLVWGSRNVSAGPRRQLIVLLAVYIVGVAPLGLLHAPWSLGLLLLGGQGAVAALLAALNALTGRLAPAGMAVETYTWLSTGNFVGTAIGTAVGSVIGHGVGPAAALSGAALPALAALIVVAVAVPATLGTGPVDLGEPARVA